MLPLLVEMALDGGKERLQVPANDFGCKIWPGDEEISFDGLEESADTWTEGGCMESLNEVSLGLFRGTGCSLVVGGNRGVGSRDRLVGDGHGGFVCCVSVSGLIFCQTWQCSRGRIGHR